MYLFFMYVQLFWSSESQTEQNKGPYEMRRDFPKLGGGRLSLDRFNQKLTSSFRCKML